VRISELVERIATAPATIRFYEEVCRIDPQSGPEKAAAISGWSTDYPAACSRVHGPTAASLYRSLGVPSEWIVARLVQPGCQRAQRSSLPAFPACRCLAPRVDRRHRLRA
jgi:hypothetical protein